MAKILYLIAQQGFQDIEYEGSRKEVEAAGHEITVASIENKECTGKYGMKLMPDMGVGDVNASEYDAVVVIGGPGTNQLAESAPVIDIVKHMQADGKVVAGICMAPSLVFSNAGIVEGKKVTCFETADGWSKQNMIDHGAEWQGGDAVVDGKLITANGPSAAKEFGKKIVEVIGG